MHLVPYAIKDPKQRKLQDFPSMTVSVYQLRPESLGSIHIRSADPDAQPAIRFNFLSDSIDQRAMVDGFRMIRRLVEAAPMDALRGEEFSPGTGVKSDDEILGWIRANSQTAYHPIGTCRMGPAGPKTVVDEQLKVHGLEGLRIADASIFPTMPSGNTNAPAHHGRRESRRPDPPRGLTTSSPAIAAVADTATAGALASSASLFCAASRSSGSIVTACLEALPY